MTTGSTAWTVLALVRHGQSEGNVSGAIGGHSATPLTDLGHRQAHHTARALAGDFTPGVVISSDLLRARQTAIPIAQACGVELVLDPRLRERSLGVLDGMSFEQAEAAEPDVWRRLRARDPDACPPGGETVDAVFTRVSQVIDDIARAHAGGRVVVVSHGLAIYHAFAHICGLGSPARGLRVFSLVENCSISRATYRGSYWYLSTLNEYTHLGDDT
jgi:probable phosphoglycerate mutase